MGDALLLGFAHSMRYVFGLLIRPYATYRTIMEKGSLWDLPFLGICIAAYLGVSSVVKTAAFRPFLLTRHFVKTSVAVVITYIVITVLLWSIARLCKGKGSYRSFAIGWAYTLVPTLIWFLGTSLLYVIFPPPRTTQMTGVSLSVVFLIFSCVLFFWKIMLGYLSLRFGMKMDLQKILLTICIAAPIIGIYSIWMYWLGIFRIPFI